MCVCILGVGFEPTALEALTVKGEGKVYVDMLASYPLT